MKSINTIYNNTRFKNLLWVVVPTIIVFSLIVTTLFLLNNIRKLNDNNIFNNCLLAEDKYSEKTSELEQSEILVPNLVNNDFNYVKDLFEKKGEFNILISLREYSNDVQKNYIISQNPPEGELVKKGSIVSVVLSLGDKTKILPNIEGLSLSEASIKLSSDGFIPEKIDSYNDKFDYGLVIGYKDHIMGENLDVGSSIKILVSKGKEIKSS